MINFCLLDIKLHLNTHSVFAKELANPIVADYCVYKDNMLLGVLQNLSKF